jgi:hypothetical protein
LVIVYLLRGEGSELVGTVHFFRLSKFFKVRFYFELVRPLQGIVVTFIPIQINLGRII